MPESADALGQAGYPTGVGLPPAVGDELAGVPKATARADLLEMPLFRPARSSGGNPQSLSRLTPGGTAYMVVRVDTEPAEDARKEIKNHRAIKMAKFVQL